MNNATLLIKKIKKFQGRQLALILGANLLNLLVCLTCIWLVTLVTDQIFFFSSATRRGLLIFNVIITLSTMAVLYLPPVFTALRIHHSGDLSSITAEIGCFYAEIQDRLTNIYQLINRTDKGFSWQLKEFAVDRFYEQVKDIDFKKQLRFLNYVFPLNTIIPLLLGSVFLMTTFDIPLALRRICYPAKEFADTPAYSFNTRPGTTRIIMGQSLEIRTQYQGPPNSGCILLYRNIEESSFQQSAMQPAGNFYQTVLPNIRRAMEYRLKSTFAQRNEWSEKIVSELYQVQVLTPPSLSELLITVTPPAYTALPRQYLQENTGDMLVYPGSLATINARSNKILKEAKVVFADSTELEARIREDKIYVQFPVKETNSYHLDLMDQDSVSSQNPIQYFVTMLEDLYPTVRLIEPGMDVEIPADGAVTLLIEGRDDFGFSALKLNYQVIGKSKLTQDSSWQVVPIGFPVNTGAAAAYFQQNYLWNFALLDVGFEDAIKYYIEIRDNDPICGPKSSRSNEYFIHFPSLETLFNDFAEKQSAGIEATEQAAEESAELQKKLEEINRELKRDKNIDWERKQEIQSSLQKQQEIQEKLEQIQQNLEAALQKLENVQLLSPELLEQYRQLQQLFQEIATPELLQTLEDLQRSLEKMNENQIQTVLQKMQLNQQQFQERLERTLELFKKVQLEQALEQLEQLAKQMLDEQKKISGELDQNKSSARESPAELENKIQSQQAVLRQTELGLDELIKNEMLENNGSVKHDLESAQELIDQQDIAARLGEINDMIRQNNPGKAGQQSQQAEQSLQQLYSALQQARQNMVSGEQARLLSKMSKISADLLQLSANQEDLMDVTKNLSDFSAEFHDMASRQQALAENMNGLIKEIIDLSHQTFFISPELSKSLGKASGGIRKTLEELENRNQGAAGKFQEQAMAGLNESVLGMQNSMQQMAQSNSALGFEQFMQSLMQMSKQQGMLNEESLNFFQGAGNQGSLTMQQQQELRRLAAEQSAIRQALERLTDETGNRSDVLGRVENLAEEMGKIVQDMEALKLDRKTIERQQQIFNRLLDAQKSVREREYSRNRQAEAGKSYAKKPPSEKLDPFDQRGQKLRQDLQRALQEGYHPAYEKIIEDYFKTLSQSTAKDQNK
jgi:hypothetical protein